MMTESNEIVKLSLGSLRGISRIEPARWIRGTRMMSAKHIFAKHVGCLVRRKFSGENQHDAQLREPLFDRPHSRGTRTADRSRVARPLVASFCIDGNLSAAVVAALLLPVALKLGPRFQCFTGRQLVHLPNNNAIHLIPAHATSQSSVAFFLLLVNPANLAVSPLILEETGKELVGLARILVPT
jgi:hypothetical protein